MARCEQGYLCEVCGEEVVDITQSDLYLRFVTGQLDARALLASPERHIRCNPALAQFIVDPAFEPVCAEGDFDKRQFDPQDVQRQESLITRGWQRLQEVRALGLPIAEYPLPEVRRDG
ncbi:MAG: hypothetical protein KY476_23805 [Planctomycetes bacterium]|nr:hypothetical protein [Planctomycetota bacterium]